MTTYRITLMAEDSVSIERDLTPEQADLLTEIAASFEAQDVTYAPSMVVTRTDNN